MDHNRLHTGCACGKAQRKKWKLYSRHHMCLWKSRRNHGTHPCSLDELIMFNDVRKQCAELWKRLFDDTTMMMTLFPPDPADYKSNLDLKINNTALPMETHLNVLGPTLDPQLRYSTHIHNISLHATNNKSTHRNRIG